MTRDALTAAGLFDSPNFYLIELISSFYIFPVRPFSLSFSLSFCVCSYASRMSLYTRVNTLILWRASTAKGLQLFREIERCCMSWPCAVLFCFSFLFYGKKNNSATRAFVVGTGALFFFLFKNCYAACQPPPWPPPPMCVNVVMRLRARPLPVGGCAPPRSLLPRHLGTAISRAVQSLMKRTNIQR